MVAPDDETPEAATDMIAGFNSVTAMGALVALRPIASVATAVRACGPIDALVLSHVTAYGGVALLPMLPPSNLYCTLTIVAVDDAVAASRMLPVTVLPGMGDEIETDTAERLNVAVTAVFAFASTVQVPMPAQAHVHPAKAEPLPGTAVSVTAAPLVNEAEQVAPQLMPAGALVRVPLPVPVLLTVRM